MPQEYFKRKNMKLVMVFKIVKNSKRAFYKY